jgi:hypothetical protein
VASAADSPAAVGAGGPGAGSLRPDAWARELGRALARAPFRADPAVVSLLRPFIATYSSLACFPLILPLSTVSG